MVGGVSAVAPCVNILCEITSTSPPPAAPPASEYIRREKALIAAAASGDAQKHDIAMNDFARLPDMIVHSGEPIKVVGTVLCNDFPRSHNGLAPPHLRWCLQGDSKERFLHSVTPRVANKVRSEWDRSGWISKCVCNCVMPPRADSKLTCSGFTFEGDAFVACKNKPVGAWDSQDAWGGRRIIDTQSQPTKASAASSKRQKIAKQSVRRAPTIGSAITECTINEMANSMSKFVGLGLAWT